VAGDPRVTVSDLLQMVADGRLRPDDELTGNRTGNISVTRDRKFVAWLDCATEESGDIFNEVDDG
jgi:hypothetical protein